MNKWKDLVYAHWDSLPISMKADVELLEEVESDD